MIAEFINFLFQKQLSAIIENASAKDGQRNFALLKSRSRFFLIEISLLSNAIDIRPLP